MRPKNRRTFVLLAAAAFLATALIAAMAFAQETPQPAAPAKPGIGPGPLAGLGLTQDQVKALEAFRKARAEKRGAFSADMAKVRDEMRQLRHDPQASQAKIDALIDKRAGLMAVHEKDAFRARAERNKIFSPEQLEKLRTMRARLADRGAAGRAWMGRGRGGQFFGPGAGLRHMARLRAFRHRFFSGWWNW